MNKYKATKKEVMNRFNRVYSVSYCHAQNLLNALNAEAYTCGVYGWNADIYNIGGGVAVCTGYRPFGIAENYEAIKQLDREAEAIWCGAGTYEEKRAQVLELVEKIKEL